MECSFCKINNPEGSLYCCQCGARLLLLCPECGHRNLIRGKFCNQCGSFIGPNFPVQNEPTTAVAERKYVTALFSDLSGYTSLCERLDPERVKEILNQLFGEIARIIKKYDGHIARLIGDEIFAFFGYPQTHEDDPVRAVRAAREIHEKAESLDPVFVPLTSIPLRMHTGISSGLVVTGELNPEQGLEGFTGNAINIASRLTKLAKAGETFVSMDVYAQTRDHFYFGEQSPTRVKGISDPIKIFKVEPNASRKNCGKHFKGRQADLTGREAELTLLLSAAENLNKGIGAVYALCGEAGTGKSRLVAEFKVRLQSDRFHWLESHAFAYSRNIPFAPLIRLLNRIFQIEDGESQRRVRHQVEAGIKDLLGENNEHVPYVGRLYSGSDGQDEILNPELGKSRLIAAMRAVLGSLAAEKPPIVCFEDLHWADVSFLEFFRALLSNFQIPGLFLCTYRPSFSLYNGSGPAAVPGGYREIRLQNLTALDAEKMLKSLLQTATIPPELQRMIHEKTGGNPFYLEEVINALIDAETLKRNNGRWEFGSAPDSLKLSTKVHGVISARLDHLEKPVKRVLQEASVIGKSFSRRTLQQISRLRGPLDVCLNELERLDLIRRNPSSGGQEEYAFKHSLIQDVVYDGLLIKERREIHEKTAHALEENHADQLEDFYETLAFHYRRGACRAKAIHYLLRSGEKCLGKFAVGEAHRYFEKAFKLLTEKGLNGLEEKRTVIDLLSKWALVFHFRGDFKGLKDLLSSHEYLARDLEDPARLGMFYILFGLVQYESGQIHESYRWLSKALAIGEEIRDAKVTGYACSWLSWTCSELCRFEEAIQYGERGIRVFQESGSDDFLFFNSLAGMGKAYWFKGDGQKTMDIGAALLSYGRECSNSRSLALGHFTEGCGHLVNGDVAPAARSFQEAIVVSADPWYSQFSRMLLGFAYQSSGQLGEAQKALEEVMLYSRRFDADIINTPARALMGLVSIASGHPAKGLKMLRRAQREHRNKGRLYALVNVEYLIGKLFLFILSGSYRSLPWGKRLKIMLRILPFGGLRTRRYFVRSAKRAAEIGAKGIEGQAYLDLGSLCLKKGKRRRAGNYFSMAMRIFQMCRSQTYLQQAEKQLASLGPDWDGTGTRIKR